MLDSETQDNSARLEMNDDGSYFFSLNKAEDGQPVTNKPHLYPDRPENNTDWKKWHEAWDGRDDSSLSEEDRLRKYDQLDLLRRHFLLRTAVIALANLELIQRYDPKIESWTEDPLFRDLYLLGHGTVDGFFSLEENQVVRNCVVHVFPIGTHTDIQEATFIKEAISGTGPVILVETYVSTRVFNDLRYRASLPHSKNVEMELMFSCLRDFYKTENDYLSSRLSYISNSELLDPQKHSPSVDSKKLPEERSWVSEIELEEHQIFAAFKIQHSLLDKGLTDLNSGKQKPTESHKAGENYKDLIEQILNKQKQQWLLLAAFFAAFLIAWIL